MKWRLLIGLKPFEDFPSSFALSLSSILALQLLNPKIFFFLRGKSLKGFSLILKCVECWCQFYSSLLFPFSCLVSFLWEVEEKFWQLNVDLWSEAVWSLSHSSRFKMDGISHLLFHFCFHPPHDLEKRASSIWESDNKTKSPGSTIFTLGCMQSWRRPSIPSSSVFMMCALSYFAQNSFSWTIWKVLSRVLL